MGINLKFLDDIEFKGNKFSIITKWIIGSLLFILIAGVGIAYTLGEKKVNEIHKLNNIENLVKKNTETLNSLEKQMSTGFNETNKKFENVYEDFKDAIDEYNEFNKKQLGLIIEYNNDNKELLKEIMTLKNDEEMMKLKNKLNSSKDDLSINFRPNKKETPSALYIYNNNFGEGFYYVEGVKESFFDTLDVEILEREENNKADSLFNYKYIKSK